MATRYWILSFPVKTTPSSLWSRLQEAVSKQSFDTPLYRFNVPDLRVGTLDSLLALSDDLLKSNAFVEGVSHKIRRQIEELEKLSGVESGALTVDGVPVDSYLTRFVWDEAKYPIMSPLREVVDGIHVQVAKIEDDLKVRVAEYNNVRSQLNTINRKQSGSLAVRDLSTLVKPEDIITSEHLVTLLAVVPKYSQKDWLSRYETLTDFVVPRSSKKLHEDNEYALYTVTLFSKVADNFKAAARDKGFQIRDFEYSPEGQETRKSELEKLMHDQESLRRSLLQWCYVSYGEKVMMKTEGLSLRCYSGLLDLAGAYWLMTDKELKPISVKSSAFERFIFLPFVREELGLLGPTGISSASLLRNLLFQIDKGPSDAVLNITMKIETVTLSTNTLGYPCDRIAAALHESQGQSHVLGGSHIGRHYLPTV
ncbi:hypothetical protein ACLOJK_019217 [Asimina triloba]